MNYHSRDKSSEPALFPAPSQVELLRQVREFHCRQSSEPGKYKVWREELNRWSLPAESMAQVDALKNGQAVAVVSGHQPCFQIGPLFVLYKIISTLQLSRWLKTQGIPAVPVFWCASEDHDLGEILSLTHLRPNGELKKTSLASHLPPRAAEALPWTERMAKTMMETLPKAWQSILCSPPLTRYTDHFIFLLLALFKSDGLLIAEPRHFKEPAISFWDMVANHGLECSKALGSQEKKLTAEKTAIQAPRRSALPLFALHEGTGIRTALSLHPTGSWSRQGSSREASNPGELLLPGERFSPGVLLRPLLTQHLLPCAVSVLGPSERLYHRQIEPLYPLLGLQQPVLYPRLSALHIPQWIKSRMTKDAGGAVNSLQGFEKQLINNILQPARGIQERVLNVFSIFENVDMFQKFRRQLDDALPESQYHFS